MTPVVVHNIIARQQPDFHESSLLLNYFNLNSENFDENAKALDLAGWLVVWI